MGPSFIMGASLGCQSRSSSSLAVCVAELDLIYNSEVLGDISCLLNSDPKKIIDLLLHFGFDGILSNPDVDGRS